MRRFPPAPRRTSVVLWALIALLMRTGTPSAQQSQPIADPNVNMVRGFSKDTSDPYLQRQNEPSIAVSTRNPCHLLAGANDYRSVDIPFDNTPLPGGTQPNISLAGDAWLGLFKSTDCGQKWSSTLLPGYPQDQSGLALLLKGHAAGADPTVRAAHNGLFYYSGMVFNRGAQGDSKIFVARLIDNNNKERGDPFQFIDVAEIDSGTKGQFLDKPWLAVDVPRASFGPGSSLATGTGNASSTCVVNGHTVAAGNVYMAWARFTGESDQHSKLMFSRSTDCGRTWKTNPISNNQQLSQGANIAIAPHDGTVYLTWREFAVDVGDPVNIWLAVSSDGGQTFSQPRLIAPRVKTFDQISSTTRFRSNALPAITADHQNRVYVAWSATGHAWQYDANGEKVATNDARIVMAVSSDRGQSFSEAFPIDPNVPEHATDQKQRRGHQLMPSLTFAAGRIQAIYYDAREDASKVFQQFIDDAEVASGKPRHTVDVRGAWATPSATPVFVPAGLHSIEVSKYRQWLVGQGASKQSIEVGANPPNLAMYAAGTTPFMGDYIDVSGLSAFPIQTNGGQQAWQPNVGPVNFSGVSVASVMQSAFPTLPIFHAAWTDNRDVRYVSQYCSAGSVPPDPKTTGERNANIYTSRLTPGLYVGSPGNTKPLGFRIDPKTNQPTTELIQRAFVVFAQNTTAEPKTYRFTIVDPQPTGGRASFRQFDKPGNATPNGAPEPLKSVVVGIPKGSTAARTVYATSTDAAAQILINIEELIAQPDPTTVADGNGGSAPKSSWVPKTGGLRASLLLNPDRTNPKIEDPDLDEFDPTVPEIAATEIHDPSMFDAQFFKYPKGAFSRQFDVKNPDPENPDPENPDPENPDPENPDPENPDPENPDPENPDPENPDPENPDPENPDPENPDPENIGVRNESISDDELRNSTITDINWRVHNAGNTTSAYRFRPSVRKKVTGTKYQLIVTRRYMTMAMAEVEDPKGSGRFICKPVYKSHNQVIVNIENFKPRTPDPENPDPENPDPENPDPENPDPENPDPENPDPENANFFLQPDETATVTLRVFTPEGGDEPSSAADVAGGTAAKAANTDEQEPATAATNADLVVNDPGATFAPAIVRPSQTVQVTWTLTNQGTRGAVSSSGFIRNNVYLSTNSVLDRFDTKIGATILVPATEAAPLPHCPANADPPDPSVCRRQFTTPVPMPSTPGTYYVIIVTDDDNDADEYNEAGDYLGENDDEVFEAIEFNNTETIAIEVLPFTLAFVQHPSNTTQDFTINPPVAVAATHADGGAVTPLDLAFVNLAIQGNPGGGTLAGTLAQPNGGGVAVFGDLRINNPGTGYTLIASAANAIPAVSAPFNIEVDAPPIVADDNYSVNEDGTRGVLAAAGVLTNDSDPLTKGIKPASYVFDAALETGPSSGTLTFNAEGSFTYTPNANFVGVDTFTYRARDGRPGNETVGTVRVTVTAVNDPPSFTAGAGQTRLEDAGPQAVAGWATSISAGPPNESSQSVTFVVTNNNPGLFSAQPAVAPDGTLTFTGAPNANGSATVSIYAVDTGGTEGGGDDTSDTQTFLIAIDAVNDPPSFTKGADQTVNEDAGAQSVASWATAISVGPADEAGQSRSFILSNSNNALFSSQPAVAPDGTLTYTPAPDANGSAIVTIRLQDNGGTANGGVDTSAVQTFTITVTAVNDTPSFTRGADQTVAEDSGAQTVPNWATAISAGPANESSQTVSFLVSSTNTGLFSAQPAVSPGGTLTFTPAADATGSALVSVSIRDSGDGANTSATQTFTITVTAASDAPVAVADSYSTNEDTPLSIGGAGVLANDTDADPGTVLTAALVTTTTQGTLALSPNGSFTYTPNANAFGADSFAYRASDGSSNSNTVTVTITVNAVNDVPGFTRGADQTVPKDALQQIVPGWATNLSVGPANESAQALDFIVSNSNNALFNVQPAVSADGTLTFAPKQNQTGTATVTVRAHDNGGTDNGGVDTSAPQTFTITITGAILTFTVTNTNDSGNGSLRAALINANANASQDIIQFNIGGAGVRTITPLTPLPPIVFPVIINGTTQPGYAGLPLIALNGTSAGAGANGLVVNAPDVTIRGLAINLFSGNGIALNNTNAVVIGNHVGINAAGTAAAGNGVGVFVGAGPNVIGGANPADRNVISGNATRGVLVQNTAAGGVVVKGNYIGTNASGTAAVGNANAGVWVEGSAAVQIGGDAAGEGNVISGNNEGVQLYHCVAPLACPGTTVAGNRIGTNAAGTAALGNRRTGIYITNSPRNVIRGNVISGNGDPLDPTSGDGIFVQAPTAGEDPQGEMKFGTQTIIGNVVGTNAAGTGGIPNTRAGVTLRGATKARIGGPAAADRNVIAYNNGAGVFIGWATSNNNVVQGNYIGVNATGTQAAGNAQNGVALRNASSNNLIAANIISANAGAGISLDQGGNSSNTIQGNTIGSDPAGTAALGNLGPGIFLANGTGNLMSLNLIRSNNGAGIALLNAGDSSNRISQNQMFDNTGLGIDLGPAGVTPNDAGDGDAGANLLQNFPVLTAANNNGGTTTIVGTLNSGANSPFTIELFSSPAADPTGYGEGRLFLGSLPATTDATGNVSFTAAYPVAAGQVITATATDAGGNTSEFSAARAVFANQAPTATNDAASTGEDAAVDVAVVANDTDPNGDPLSITSLVQPANGTALALANGTITYTPAANFFGTDSFTYRVSDGRGGLSAAATVNLTITAVNDAPSFIKGPNQSVQQNAGLQTVPAWATAISAGPANESAQAVTFLVSNDNTALFDAQPAISPGGTLTFDPADGVAGSALVSVQLQDNGGTSPGVDTSAVETFTITIVSTGAATYVVTNRNDSGNGSLRQALLNANATPFNDVITFDISGGGSERVIQPQTPLPVIAGAVTIDGTTQSGYDGKPRVRLHGSNIIANGLETATDVAGVVVKGLSITGFTNAGLYLLQAEGQGGHVIESNFIGTDRDHGIGLGNGTGIVLRTDGSEVRLNVLSGNAANGIRLENDADNVTLVNNRIGTTQAGDAALPNTTGVLAYGSLNNLVIENNVVSANTGWGIDLQDLATDDIVNATLRGNTVGLLADGSTAAGNGSGGVRIDNARGTVLGEPGQPRNVIGGNNGPGIHLIGSPVPMPLVQHNYIGTDGTGTAARGNATGILVTGISHALIGGTTAGAGNVISGNAGFGIEVSGSTATAATIIQGNLIGLAADGNAALGNAGAGIKTTNGAVQVGGTTAAARNVIAANPQGVSFSNSGGTFNSFVVGNYFGTDVTGMIARGNSTGVLIGSAPGTRVGGEQPGMGNLFAGNSIGVTTTNISHPIIDGLYNTVIQGNTFGVNAAGAPLPNGRGLSLNNSDNLVGGATAPAANVIAHNTGVGVQVGDVGTRNRILRNSIFSNGDQGIGLGLDGVTLNDEDDTDLGANTKQNFPVIAAVVTGELGTTVSGTINTTANTVVTIELFANSAPDPSGYGEGEQFIGTVDVTTDNNGDASFSTAVAAVPAGRSVTATATALGSTSEFSQARVVNLAQTATSDSDYTISGQPATFYPAANDADPEVASPSIRTVYQPTGSTPILTSPGDVAIVSSTGLGYFSGGNLAAATDGKIGILNLATNTIAGAIPMRGGVFSTMVRVSQSTRIAYMRTGNFLQAIDGRPESPTFNQSILNVFFGPIQSMALNETTKRLYATALSTGTGLIANGRVVVIDIDPTSPTFHEILDQVTVPSFNGTASAIAVNPATNKIYVGMSGSQSGVWVLDGTTHALAQVGNGLFGSAHSIAVNDVDNVIYAVQFSNLYAIDGATDQRIATIPLPMPANLGVFDTRLAIHRGSGQVFVRLAEFPNPSRLVIVDGKKTSATFNTIIGTLALGRENNQTIVAIDEAANRLITTSTTDHESAIIDTTTNGVLATIKSTQNALRASIDPQTHRAYVTGAIGHLQVIDLSTATLLGNVQVGVELFGVAVDTAAHAAYVAQTGATGAVVRLNETGVIGAVPLPHVDGRQSYAARNSVTGRVYVLNSGATAAGGADPLPGFVQVIENNLVTASVPVGAQPFGLAVDEVANRIYVGNLANNAGVAAGITVINGADNTAAPADLSAIAPTQLGVFRDLRPNTATGKLYFRMQAGQAATQLGVLNGLIGTPLADLGNVNTIRVNPVLNRVYVGATDALNVNRVTVLNGDLDKPIAGATLTVGFPSSFITNQSYLEVNTTTGRVYAADFLNHRLSVIDGSTNAIVATIPVGRGPSAVAVNHAANRVYVGNAIERSLTIIDGATNRVVRTLPLPLAPVFIAVDDTISPARLYVQSTANESRIAVVDDPGTAAPQITAITQPASGTAVLNADGSVTYTPNAGFSGTDSYTYTTSDGQGGVVTATAFVTVAPALTITTAAAANGMLNVPYSQTFTTTGGTGGVTWFLIGTLPGGLSITPAGVLSGTPAQAGTFNFTMQARDSGTPPQIVSAPFTMLIGPPTVAPGTLPNGTVNVAYSQQLFLGAGVGNVTWSLETNGHPALAWLSLSTAGVLSGTHTVYGNTPPFTVTATDSLGQVASRSYTINFVGPLDMTALREGVVLETPSSLPIVGGNGQRSATVTGGALPPGLTLNSNGSFSGSPQQHGTYDFTLELRDCSPPSSCGQGTVQQVVTRNVSWRISAREQQNGSSPQPNVAFGGPGGRRIAQVVTAGAHGTLTAISAGVSCPSAQTPLLVEIQRLTEQGLPDGTTIASGTTISGFGSAIAIAPPVPVSIGDRFAFVLSTPVSCNLTNASTSDNYQAGDAWVSAGGGWTTLFSTDGRYDVPSFRTLIQPAMDVIYLRRGRGAMTATLLNDGKVLLAGNSTSAELYDPATNVTTVIAPPMAFSRTNHTATLLSDGRVLIVGGSLPIPFPNRTASAEIYDPVTNTFTTLPASLALARDRHQAVRLNDGRVLIMGGSTDTVGRTAATEIYDPATQTFSAGPSLSVGREQFNATLLLSGKVLVTGGYTNCCGNNAELFDPATESFSAAGAMVLANRGQSTATLLPDGKVLIAGGQAGDIRAEAELYDPATNTFTAAGTMLGKRYVHTATLLDDGSVLIAGGFDAQSHSSYTLPLPTLERYVPGTGFVSAGGMAVRRATHAAVRLGNNKVLLAGGFSQSWMTGNTAELYDPSSAVGIAPTTLADGSPGAAYPAVVFSRSGGQGLGYTITREGGALPPGMSYDEPTRTLSGTPAASGVFAFSLRVSETGGGTNVQAYTLRVGAGNVITSPYRLPDVAQNQNYNVQLAATGAPPIAWSLLPAASALPPGITLSSSGLLNNAPTSQGYYNFGVRAVDSNGVEAIKILSISVVAPMTITTTALGNVDLFGGGLGCVGVSNGQGTRTWSISAGAAPAGITINANNGCFNGSALETGTFTFTVRVTDSINQVATRDYTINSWALDQNTGGNFSQPALVFGGTIAIAERVIAGIDGTLRAVRLNGNFSCPAGTIVSARIEGLRPDGAPDGNLMASGQAVAPFGNTIVLTSGVFFAADAQYAIVFGSDQNCTIHPNNFDAYPGDGWVATNLSNWQTQLFVDGRYDIPFSALVEPAGGLVAMSVHRGDHAETLLANGKVLLTGGNGTSSADLFDPATNTVSQVMNTTVNPATVSTLTTPRSGHTATRLNNGLVLIAGGSDNMGNRLASAEMYDPSLGTLTAIAPMAAARSEHTATLLPDGKVLLAGGRAQNGASLATAELFDPAANSFTTLAMLGGRSDHTATRLDDGRVLLAGGYGFGPAAELFSYGSMTFTATDTNMAVRRGRHTATLLADGTVLIAGGTSGAALSGAEIFEPSPAGFPNGRFTAAAAMSIQRDDHTAVRLADGSVLVAGGLSDTTCCGVPHEPQATMERYVPGTGWVNASSLRVARYRHTATVLVDGRVLLAGTWGWTNAGQRLAEIYDPAAESHFAGATSVTGTMGAEVLHALQPDGTDGPWAVTRLSGRLPDNLSFNSGSATIAGTPAEPGTFTASFKIEDAQQRATYETVTIRINPVVITSGALAVAYQGVYYEATLAGEGVGGIQSWQLLSGINSLPAGLAFNSNGTITGTTSATCCTYSITVRAVDSIGQTATKVITITVQLPLRITTTALNDGTAGQTYGGCIGFNGGVGPHTWSITGAVPIGLELDSFGCFKWAWPTYVIRQGGSFSFTVRVTDSSNPPQEDLQDFTVRFHALDQSPGWTTSAAVSLPASRRVAQVFRAASSFPLSAVQIPFNLTCDGPTQLTASIYPVTGNPPRPDDSGGALGQGSVTANGAGFFNGSMVAMANQVQLYQGSLFAVVLSFSSGTCSSGDWPTSDYYRYGEAWVDDGGGWGRGATTIGRYDIPLSTLVMPPSELRFLSTYRGGLATATLNDNRVLIAGSDQTIEVYNPATHTLANTSVNMDNARHQSTATTLADGRVLIVGGQYWNGSQQLAASTTTIYTPATGAVQPGPGLPYGVFGHRATRLNNGKVLITGGWTLDVNGNYQTLGTAIVIDAAGGGAAVVNMTGARVRHSATRLADGRVVVIGGWTGNPWPSTVAEIYDPASGPDGAFSAVTANAPFWPSQHTATLLSTGPNSGRIAIIGGSNGPFPELDPDGLLFDPAVPSFSAGPALNVARFDHVAAEFADGRIAIVGGTSDWLNGDGTSVVEVYDPATGVMSSAGDLIVDRQAPGVDIVTIGAQQKLAVSGGWGSGWLTHRTIEIFDINSGALAIGTTSLPDGSAGIAYPATALTASGGTGAGYSYLVVAGQLPPGLSLSLSGVIAGTPAAGGVFGFVVQVQDGANAATRRLAIAIDRLTVTSPNTLPSAVTGAQYSYQFTATGVGAITWTVEPYSALPGTMTLTPAGLLSGTAPGVDTWSNFTLRISDSSGQVTVRHFNLQTTSNASWFAMNPMSIARRSHISVALNDGMVLLAGSEAFGVVSSELYNPQSGVTVPTGNLNQARCYGCASVKLDDGTVLAAGGWNGGPVLSSAETYDRLQGVWTLTNGAMTTARLGPNAVKLNSGLVLILGGHNGFAPHSSAELYNPATRTFAPTNTPMNVARTGPGVVKLADGRVLVAGGQAPGGLTASAEIYDPVTGTFTMAPGNMATPRQVRDAILLPDGRVLIAGDGSPTTANAEIFDPGTGLFSSVGAMSTPRAAHSMVLMPYGKVLVFGGIDQFGNVLASAEMFDPAGNSFSGASWLLAPRAYGNATLLPTGEVLVTGGSNASGQFVATVEKYRPW